MSYDLTFYAKEDHSISEKDIRKYFQKQDNFFTTEDTANEWVVFSYSNENTGVYFDFTYTFNAIKDEFLEIKEAQAQNYIYSGIECRINLIRATFFSYEIMPVVEDFQNYFNLGVFNPQLDEQKIFEYISTDELIDSWLKSNYRVLISFYEQIEPEDRPIYIRHDISKAIWTYMYWYPTLSEKFASQECFIPKLYLFYDKKLNKAVRLVSWLVGEYQAIPECEFIILDQNNDPEQAGVIEYSKLMPYIDKYLIDFGISVPGLKLVAREQALKDQLDKILSNLKLIPFADFINQQKESWAPFAMDKFVDMEL